MPDNGGGVLVLASGSRFRQDMLRDAGVDFEVALPDLDERALAAPLENSNAAPADVALILAEAKAVSVSETLPGRWVLGCDQTLSLGDRLFHKPRDMEDARRHLLALSGRTHQLNSAAVLARDGEARWRHLGTADMTVRKLDPAFVGRHLAKAGDAVLGSVGAYQIEGLGVGLFERVEGDYWTIVGLPLLPVLGALRERGLVDA
ncbi:MAG TPA: Maf-like protein [Mesorhizobium sp.]|jgi:septum formation protein|nr:Maf-like protein [Mesorhizobium sp.]